MSCMPSYDAIVLAGGSGRRLGGVDKAGLRVGEQTLLDRALDAVAGASKRVVVGPPRALPPGVLSASEEPPGGGPVAAIEAGLAEVSEPLVVVLACDMPLINPGVVAQMVAAAAGPGGRDTEALVTATSGSGCCDGVLLVDERGHRQPLAAVYCADSLRRAIAGLGTARDAAMRELVAQLGLVELPARPHTTLDCDTWESVARSRVLLEEA